MKRLILVVLAIVAVGYLMSVVFAQAPVPGQPELKVGDQAPDFTLPGTDGKTYTLSKLRGQYVVLAWFPKAFTAG